MRIILEGPDASGKSTLAEHLSRASGLPIIRGTGPVKPGTASSRFTEHDHVVNAIFDRHVRVSEYIYGPIFQRQVYDRDIWHVPFFRDARNLFIYCRNDSLLSHVATSSIDTPEYLEALQTHFARVVATYDAWAMDFAHIVYRKGDLITPAMINSWIRRLNNVA